MPAIPPQSLVLITGVNGYIASHIVPQLLQRGYRVRGTVRDTRKAEYIRAVFEGKYGKDAFDVQIVEDMTNDGAFDEVVKGCSGVIHVASDVSLNPDPHQVIPLVLAGIKNALNAAARTPTVKRFVYTSSSTAATAAIANKKFHVDDSSWNDADVEAAWAPPPYTSDRMMVVYGASKTLAEKECWRFVREEKPGFALNAVLPDRVLGTILSKDQSGSTGGFYRRMWNEDPAAIAFLRDQLTPQHYVNVTDTALLHLAALLEEDVVGERLFAFAGPFDFNETVDLMEKIATEGEGNGNNQKHYERIEGDAPKDLKTVDTKRAKELLRRYGRPEFTSLEVSLRETITSSF